MDWDEAVSRKSEPPKYDIMSIEDLEARIAALEAEIVTIRDVIEQKRTARGAAATFFKK